MDYKPIELATVPMAGNVPFTDNSTPGASSSDSKPKRSRKNVKRRPKTIPVSIRQRLAHLGHMPTVLETSDANLHDLIQKLTSDLKAYQIEAQLWQDKCMHLTQRQNQIQDQSNLQTSNAELNFPFLNVNQNSSTISHHNNVIHHQSSETRERDKEKDDYYRMMADGKTLDMSQFSTSHLSSINTNQAIHRFEEQLIDRMNVISHGSLTLSSLKSPNFQSSISNILDLTRGETGHSIFNDVLEQMSSLASVFGIYSPSSSKWSGLSKLKPDFSDSKAKFYWDILFSPINVPLSKLNIEASSSSRRQIENNVNDGTDFMSKQAKSTFYSSTNTFSSHEDSNDIPIQTRYLPDDDGDAIDAWFREANDFDVVDMLHYGALFLGGFSAKNDTNGYYEQLKKHLGANCERLLREVIFSRNCTATPALAQGVVQGISGLIRYFEYHQRFGAMSSLLDMSWQISVSNTATVHPVTRGFIAFLSALTSKQTSKRQVWMERLKKTVHSTKQNFFHLAIASNIADAYNAVIEEDEETLWYSLSVLEELAAPGDAASRIAYSKYQFDFTAPCQLAIHHITDTSNKSIMNSSASYSNVINSNVINSNASYSNINSNIINSDASYSNIINSNTSNSVPTSSCSSPIPNLPSSPSSSSSSSFTSVEFLGHHNNLPTSFHSPTFIFGQATFDKYNSMIGDDNKSSHLAERASETQPLYVPDERLKAVVRVAVALLRAEAALIRQDAELVLSWVDEAEKIVKSYTPGLLFHRLLPINDAPLNRPPSREFDFPSGRHSIAVEFQKRVKAYNSSVKPSNALCGWSTCSIKSDPASTSPLNQNSNHPPTLASIPVLQSEDNHTFVKEPNNMPPTMVPPFSTSSSYLASDDAASFTKSPSYQYDTKIHHHDSQHDSQHDHHNDLYVQSNNTPQHHHPQQHQQMNAHIIFADRSEYDLPFSISTDLFNQTQNNNTMPSEFLNNYSEQSTKKSLNSISLSNSLDMLLDSPWIDPIVIKLADSTQGNFYATPDMNCDSSELYH